MYEIMGNMFVDYDCILFLFVDYFIFYLQTEKTLLYALY